MTPLSSFVWDNSENLAYFAYDSVLVASLVVGVFDWKTTQTGNAYPPMVPNTAAERRSWRGIHSLSLTNMAE